MTNRLRERLRAVERALTPSPRPVAGLPEVLRRSGMGPPMSAAEALRYDWRPIESLMRARPTAAAPTLRGDDDDARPDPSAA